MRRKPRKRALRSSPDWCYLCGFPIPAEIASSRHPLFGTVDHIIPLSRSGPDVMANRAPAHRLCNERKGHFLVDPQEFALELRSMVVPLLESLGYQVTRKLQRSALSRAIRSWPSWAPRPRREPGFVAFHRWEDDGGNVFPAPDAAPECPQTRSPCSGTADRGRDRTERTTSAPQPG